MTTSQDFVSIQFRGKSHTVPLDPGSATCSDLLAALQQSIPGLAPETLKVLVSKPRTRSVQLLQQSGLPLSDAGLHPGSRCLLLGSFISELQDLQDNKKAEASLRLPDFDHEAQQVRLRSNSRSGNINTPPGAHCFGGFQVLPLPVGAGTTVPPPAAALSLLHQLAADPAVVHVMKQHHWKVGLLSEMPAAGRVGVSAVCILGYNVNQGQEISLRLRTDDYRGFRKYLRIRETLMHELAHMVYSDHDNNFKALNSQLLKEVASFETAAVARGGRTLVGGGVFDDHWLGQQQQQQQQGAAAAVAQGHTLGGVSTAAGSSLMAARQAAAAAALTRWQQQPQVTDTQSVLEAISLAAADSGPIPSAVVDEAMKQAGAEQPSTAAAAAAADWVQDDSPSDDPFTAAAEEQMRRLGSMEEQQQQQHHQQQQQQQQQHGSQEHVQQAEGDKQQQQHEQLSNLKSIKQQQQQSVEDVKTFTCTSDATSCAGVIHLEDHSEHVAVEPAAAVAAANDMTEGCVDDVVADKLQQVQTCLQQLEQQANSNNTAALQGVQGVLSSIVQHPHEPKYRRLRCNNAVYQRRIGQYPAAVQLLKLAGFSQQQQEWVPTAGPEAVMVYVRDDPGLLWLVLSVVRERLE